MEKYLRDVSLQVLSDSMESTKISFGKKKEPEDEGVHGQEAPDLERDREENESPEPEEKMVGKPLSESASTSGEKPGIGRQKDSLDNGEDEEKDHHGLFDLLEKKKEKKMGEEDEEGKEKESEDEGPGALERAAEMTRATDRLITNFVDDFSSESEGTYPRMRAITFILVQLWLLGFGLSVALEFIDGNIFIFSFISFVALLLNILFVGAARMGAKKEEEGVKRDAIIEVAGAYRTGLHMVVTIWLVIIYLSFVRNLGDLHGNKTYQDCALLAFSINLLLVASEVLIKKKHSITLLDEQKALQFGGETLRFIKSFSQFLITILLGAIWLGFVYGVIDGPDPFRNLTLVAFGVYVLILISERVEGLDSLLKLMK